MQLKFIDDARVEKDPDEFEYLESEKMDDESGNVEFEVSTHPADYTLEVLYNQWKRDKIIIPDFQRNYVWSMNQASRLIESFLMGLPVPAIFLYVGSESNKFLVIDGQQRLKSVFYFMDGFFGEAVEVGNTNTNLEKLNKRKQFKLSGLNEKSKYYNLLFSELDDKDKERLNDCVLRAFVIKQIDPDDNTSIYHIFERLNTGGTLLSNQEIRNCVYSGRFNNLLHELNEYPNWRKVFTKGDLDNRQADIELILRFFALQEGLSSYTKPMKEFMSTYMSKKRFITEVEFESKRALFIDTIDKIINSLGNRPFHVRRGLSSSTFDAVMYAFSECKEVPLDIKSRFNKLCEDPTFIKHTTRATSDPDGVRVRIDLAKSYLFGV